MFHRASLWALRCALVVAAGVGTASAGYVTVDGNLSDWGSSNAFSAAYSSNPIGTWKQGLDGSYNGFTYSFFEEDQSDTAGHGGALGPNAGGQDYDAEFLGVGIDGTKLVISIVTGQRPDNGKNSTHPNGNYRYFSPGDIRIETSLGVFGVEVGGGLGGGGQTQVVEGNAGTTYTVDSNGYTTGLNAGHEAAHVAGSIWLGANWISDPIGPLGSDGPPDYDGREPVQQFTGGTRAGGAGYLADYIYLFDSTLGQHAVIELSIDLTVFGVDTSINRVQWAPSCGNDFVFVNLIGVTTVREVPEPATFVLGLLGIAGVAGVRRFRRDPA